jgi:hypothetical protein
MATRIEYKFGLLSISEDLRQPGAKAEPVAVVGTGHDKADGSWHAFALVRGDVENLSSTANDPVAIAVLRQMLKSLSERIDAAAANKIPPTELLDWIAGGLGGSVSFSWIKTGSKTFASSAAASKEIAPLQKFKGYLLPKPKMQSGRRSGKRKTQVFSRYTVEPLYQPSGCDSAIAM